MIRHILIATAVGIALISSTTSIDPLLVSLLTGQGSSDVVVAFTGNITAVIEEADNMVFLTRAAKAEYIKKRLEELSKLSQIRALEILASRPQYFYSSWSTNRLYVKQASLDVLKALSNLTEVTEIRKQLIANILDPVPVNNNTIEVEWSVRKIEAPAVWDTGVNGSGVVVAVIDTGVRATHQSLSTSWRENYGWFDSIYNTTVPTDHHVHGHGSHVTGTIVGSEGVGVAPGAKWIACVGCDEFGTCPEAAVVRCGEWAACPTLPNGSSQNCSLIADIVSNSWGFTGTGHTFYDPVINLYRANGIIPIFAAGNQGNCGSITYPGSHKDVITVTATDSDDTLAGFASRGSSQDNLIKPDISAPGVGILSASHKGDSLFRVASGTSMAAPHISGVVALLISRNSTLDYTQIKTAIYKTAERNMTESNKIEIQCDGSITTQWPNSVYGYGRVNALKAINSVPLLSEVVHIKSNASLATGSQKIVRVSYTYPIIATLVYGNYGK